MRIPEIVSKTIFAKKTKLRDEALAEEHLPRKELKRAQWRKFKMLIEHAYENVPFYTRLFKNAGITPEDIQDLEDIQKIPIITKEELRKNFPDKLKARNLPEERFKENSTSGSTGKPFRYFIDTASEKEERKALFREHNAIGLNFGDTIVRMRSRDIRTPDLKGKILKKIGNTKHISTTNMSLGNMEKYLDYIRKHKPKVLESFPHHILALAQYMEENNIKLHVPILKLVGGNANQVQRKILKDCFSCGIYNEYGASESMHIAYQCEKLNMYHIDESRYIVELIHKGRPARSGEYGEMIITNLTNYAMPLIRYRIRDIAVAGGRCSCGRSFATLKEITGRLRSTIILKNGFLLDPNTVCVAMKPFYNKIEEFQVAYTKEKKVEIRIIPKDGFDKKCENEIKSRVREVIRKGAPVILKTVRSIKKYGEEQKGMATLAQAPPDLTKVQ